MSERIVMLSVGSRGDLQPYVALGKGLIRAGYRVCLATHPPYRSFVERHGLEFAPLEGDPPRIIQDERAKAWLESGRNLFAAMRRMQSLFRDLYHQMFVDIWHACQGADAVIYAPLAMPAYFAAEKLGIPHIAAPLIPLGRSREYPSISFPRTLPRWLNPISHTLSEQIFWQAIRRPFNRAIQEVLGMSPLPLWGPYRRLYGESLPFLYGFSAHVFPRPADWPAHHHITGYWFLDHDPDWQPPADLVDFLEAGPPPVYVGFGSMVGRDPERTAEIVLAALRRSDQRGVLLRGWGGLQATDLPDDVIMVSDVPHDWLFPRMAAVVHHGGAGTTAAGLRAGVPTVVVPFFVDQPFWGERVHALGVGPRPILQKKLTVARLTEAIRQAVNDLAVRDRAAALGRRIRQEDGVKTAVRCVQSLLDELAT